MKTTIDRTQVELDRILRHLLTQPITLMLAVSTTVFTCVFSPDFYLGRTPYGLRFALNGFNLVLYWSCTYLFFGHALARGLHAGVPWALIQNLFYVPLGLVSALLFFAATDAQITPVSLLSTFVAVMVIVVLTVYLTLLLFRGVLERLLSDLGHDGLLFRFRPQVDVPRDPAALLPTDAPVLMLRGANQYVEVTTPLGVSLVRARLRDAVAAMPPDQGMQINRSVWLAWGHMDAVSTSGKRLQISDKSGASHNVSDGRVAEFRQRAASHLTL